MQLYYSGALKANLPQIDPSKSLGGFVSSTLIGNGSLNNIFSAITKDTVRNLYLDCRLIVLKNTTGSTVTAINIYTTRGTYSFDLTAGVAPAINSCGDPVFESLQDGRSIPFQATLAAHEGSGAAIVVASLADQACIGIWIQRNLDPSQFSYIDGLTGGTAPDCPTLNTLLTAQAAQPTVYDNGQLIISWT